MSSVPDAEAYPASFSAGILTEEPEVDPASFSAGIKPLEEHKEQIGVAARTNNVVAEEFLHSNANRYRFRRRNSLIGQNTIFEYACSSESVLGHVSAAIGVECIRLSRDTIGLADSNQVEQLLQHVELRPGADGWISLPCADYTPWQHMNIHRHGEAFDRKLHERRKKSNKMFKFAKRSHRKSMKLG